MNRSQAIKATIAAFNYYVKLFSTLMSIASKDMWTVVEGCQRKVVGEDFDALFADLREGGA
jgi:hypothetical protein